MNISLTQKMLSVHYRFDIAVNGERKYHAKANRAVWPVLRKIEVSTLEDKTVLTLKQNNYWLRFIETAWIYGCPFDIASGGRKIGWIRRWFRPGQPMARAEIENDNYDIYIHRNNRISVCHNGSQVGLITREPWKEWDGDKYLAEFDDDISSIQGVTFLLFTDIVWFTGDTSGYSHQKTEYIPIKGVEEDANWRPGK